MTSTHESRFVFLMVSGFQSTTTMLEVEAIIPRDASSNCQSSNSPVEIKKTTELKACFILKLGMYELKFGEGEVFRGRIKATELMRPG